MNRYTVTTLLGQETVFVKLRQSL